MSMWIKEFLYYADVRDTQNFPFVVLGNKIDMEERQVKPSEGKSWCDENKMPYFETSAKDAINVDVAFTAAVRRVMELEDYLDSHRPVHNDTVDLSKKAQRGGCC